MANFAGNDALIDYQNQLQLPSNSRSNPLSVSNSRRLNSHSIHQPPKPSISSPLTQPAWTPISLQLQTPPKYFTRFPLLPPELRLSIWRIIIHNPRIVHLAPDQHNRLHSYTPVPSVLHVNHESRTEALRYYVLFGNTKPTTRVHPATKQLVKGIFYGRTYLNSEVDLVSFGENPENASKLYWKGPQFLGYPREEVNLSDSHAKLIQRVAEEGDSAILSGISPLNWIRGMDEGTYSIFSAFPNIKEFYLLAPGFGFGEARDLERGGWDEGVVGEGEALEKYLDEFGFFMKSVDEVRARRDYWIPDIRIVTRGVWKGIARTEVLEEERSEFLKCWVTRNLDELCAIAEA